MTNERSTRWWIPTLLAVQFLTRLPVPGLGQLTSEQARHGLKRAVIWFPFVGAMIGAITAAVLVGFAHIWPKAVAVILALAIEVRLTGGFHEDAVADFCDGFGGGQDAESTHRIMKDSQIGSYGVLGLVFAVGLRAAILIALPQNLIIPSLIASACFGRLTAVATMTMTPPAVKISGGLAKDIGSQTSMGDLLVALLIAAPFLGFFVYLQPLAALYTLAGTMLFLFWFRHLLLKKLGGSSGDCLGFAAYVGQLILLLAALATTNSITS